jgi:hypothetical protein
MYACMYVCMYALCIRLVIFWFFVPCSLLEVFPRFWCDSCLHRQCVGRHLWNVGKLLPDYTAQQPNRRPPPTPTGQTEVSPLPTPSTDSVASESTYHPQSKKFVVPAACLMSSRGFLSVHSVYSVGVATPSVGVPSRVILRPEAYFRGFWDLRREERSNDARRPIRSVASCSIPLLIFPVLFGWVNCCYVKCIYFTTG